MNIAASSVVAPEKEKRGRDGVVGGDERLARIAFTVAVIVLCAWVLVPIWLLIANTFSTPEEVNAFPKPFVPSFDTESVEFFLGFAGVGSALLSSILVASVTMILSISIGAPAGYALSRFEFRGKNTFRILVLMTRAFPLPLLALPMAVLFHPRRARRYRARARPRAHDARVAVRRADHLLAVLRGCRSSSRRPPGRSAARDCRRSGRSSCRWSCQVSRRPRSSPSSSRGTRCSPRRCSRSSTGRCRRSCSRASTSPRCT